MAVTLKKVVGDAFHKQAAIAESMKAVMMDSVAAVKKLSLGKGKVTVVQDSVLVECPKESMQDVLAAIGMTTAPVAPKKEEIAQGDRVVVTNSLFFWLTSYKAGDQGEVLKVHSPVKEAVQHGEGYGLLEVLMDSGATVILHVWEVDRVVAV